MSLNVIDQKPALISHSIYHSNSTVKNRYFNQIRHFRADAHQIDKLAILSHFQSVVMSKGSTRQMNENKISMILLFFICFDSELWRCVTRRDDRPRNFSSFNTLSSSQSTIFIDAAHLFSVTHGIVLIYILFYLFVWRIGTAPAAQCVRSLIAAERHDAQTIELDPIQIYSRTNHK